jgi:hypothetical protein
MICEAVPCNEISIDLVSPVVSVFISTRMALLSLAYSGRVLAGETFKEVPIMSKDRMMMKVLLL